MFEFALPDLGEGVAEGEVLEWHVAVGDRVAEDDVLAEVETDKAAVDVPSPVDGVVRELHAEVGDVVSTGERLVSIEEGSEADDGEAAEPVDADGTTEDGPADATSGGRVFAAPSVRRLAREQAVDITAVEGSGPGGRVTEADVEAAASGSGSDGPKSAISSVDDASDDGPTSVVSTVDDSDGPKSVVSKVNSDAESDAAADSESAVKSAVRRVDASMGGPRERTLATPATRKLARELDVDIDAVPTDETRDGEPYVDAAAVRAVAQQQGTEVADAEVREVAETVVSGLREAADEAERPSPTGAAGAEQPPTVGAVGAEQPPTVDAAEGDRREPYRGIRRTIGEQMARSRREVPHATHHDKVAVPGLVEARERLQPLAEERGVSLTYTPFLLKCVATALDAHPVLATQLDTESEEIVYREARDIGVATATDHGLVVPVVSDVDEKGLLELAADLSDRVDRARSRDLAREELQSGVFTVTNFGAIGGEYADPVINVPETAILGVGALKERPIARDGAVVAESTLTLSLAIDHRVIDGADAARFVNTLKSYLADPTRLLLD